MEPFALAIRSGGFGAKYLIQPTQFPGRAKRPESAFAVLPREQQDKSATQAASVVRLEAMFPGWSVVYGEYSKHYTAMSAAFGIGLLVSPDANELSRQIIDVQQRAAAVGGCAP
ncbi:hypothetical protein [Actinomadura harenae]|uniref:Uncharacterized protein n=1 Tax=Actinomadura harenae TaxID=2483351 RepID=A0A3M2LF39_9ACTN|nr:hypothetical protein [Actinomadura harenae]RMI36014.1 hypothetical protein EBO15_39790 [Actinomadura harenae]